MLQRHKHALAMLLAGYLAVPLRNVSLAVPTYALKTC